jgi:hypothetical protein
MKTKEQITAIISTNNRILKELKKQRSATTEKIRIVEARIEYWESMLPGKISLDFEDSYKKPETPEEFKKHQDNIKKLY